MSEIATLERVLWGLTFVLNVGLFFLLFFRKSYRIYPFFCLYAASAALQNIAFFESYRIWGFGSPVSFKIAWGAQGLVSAARALAVAEICRRVLAKYRGIWGLGWRIFFAVGGLVLVYALAVGGHTWQLVAVTADRSLELAIAVAILALLAFAHYYEVVVDPSAKLLAIGFFLYSCFQVLNDAVLERWLTRYAGLWNLFGTFAFLASLVLWTWAVRLTEQNAASGPELLPEHQYRSLSPAINERLKALNEQLGHFWYAEGKKT